MISPRRKVASAETSSAEKEAALQRMLLSRPATAAKLNRRELERLVRMLLITNAKQHRQALAFAIYQRRPIGEVAALLNLGDRRVKEIVRTAELRLKQHESDLKRDAILNGLVAPALTKGTDHA